MNRDVFALSNEIIYIVARLLTTGITFDIKLKSFYGKM